MADRTKIEWADATLNVATGCTQVSPGCANCYIPRTPPFRKEGRTFDRGHIPVRLHPERLEIPGRWRKPRRIFVCSLADLWHEQVPDEFIGRVFAVAALAPQHIFMFLTKRADRMEEVLTSEEFWWRVAHGGPDGQRNGHDENVHQLPNVELGVSVENQHFADLRLPHLVRTPAARRFVSYEPALGAVDFAPFFEPTYGCDMPSHVLSGRHGQRLPPIDRVICGGESGPRARPMHLDWPRGVRDQCVAAGVEFVFKQHGGWLHESQGSIGYPRGRPPAYYEWPDGSYSYRIGKAAAGAVLDGREWPMTPTGGQ